jgi:hypothetical protein
MVEEFRRSYEFITDNVIPYSAKQLKIPEKDGLTLWYIHHNRGPSIYSMPNLTKTTTNTKTMIPKIGRRRGMPHPLLNLLIRLGINSKLLSGNSSSKVDSMMPARRRRKDSRPS